MGKDNSTEQLRAQAEAWLAGAPESAAALPDGAALGHEWRVQQVELELLREALAQSQQALEQARQRYRELFEQSPLGYLTLTGSGLIVEANVSAATLLGVARKELLDQRFADFVAVADRPYWLRQVDEIMTHGAPLVFELALGDATSFSRQVQIHGRRVATDAGPTVCLGLTDMSGRQAAEDLLRKLSLAVEQSPESIVITNLAGEIEYVNDAFVRIAGYSRESLIGRNMSILQSGKTPPQTYRALWDALSHGRHWQGDFINRREDGSEYVESAIITPLRQPDGRITHYVAVKSELSGRDRREEAPASATTGPQAAPAVEA